MERSLLYYEVARERLQSQEALNTEIGSKVIGLSGLGLAILTASAIILRVSDAKLGIGEPVSWVFAGLILAFLAAAWMYSLSVLPRHWERGPRLTTLSEHLSTDYTDDVLTTWVSNAYRDSVEENKPVLTKRATALRRGVGCLIVETVLLAVVTALCCLPLS